MEEKKNNNGLIVLIIILSVCVLGLGGYVIYDKVFSKKENTLTNTETSTQSLSYSWQTNDKIKMIQKDYDVEDVLQGGEYDIQVLLSNNIIKTNNGYSNAFYDKTGDNEYIIAFHGKIDYDECFIDVYDYKTLNLINHYPKSIGYRIENEKIVVYTLNEAIEKGFVKLAPESPSLYYRNNDVSFIQLY